MTTDETKPPTYTLVDTAALEVLLTAWRRKVVQLERGADDDEYRTGEHDGTVECLWGLENLLAGRKPGGAQ